MDSSTGGTFVSYISAIIREAFQYRDNPPHLICIVIILMSVDFRTSVVYSSYKKAGCTLNLREA